MNKSIPFLFAVAAIAIAGCGEKAAAPAAAPATSAPAVASGGALPPECDAYIKTVTACVEKVGGTNPAVAMFKQQMEKNRAEWAKVQNKTSLAPACKQMDDTFKSQTAPTLKC